MCGCSYVCVLYMFVCESSLIARHARGESASLTADIECHRLLASTELSLNATPGNTHSAEWRCKHAADQQEDWR